MPPIWFSLFSDQFSAKLSWLFFPINQYQQKVLYSFFKLFDYELTSNLAIFDARLRSLNSSCIVPVSAVLISMNDGAARFILIRLHGTFVIPMKHGYKASPSSN